MRRGSGSGRAAAALALLVLCALVGESFQQRQEQQHGQQAPQQLASPVGATEGRRLLQEGGDKQQGGEGGSSGGDSGGSSGGSTSSSTSREPSGATVDKAREAFYAGEDAKPAAGAGGSKEGGGAAPAGKGREQQQAEEEPASKKAAGGGEGNAEASDGGGAKGSGADAEPAPEAPKRKRAADSEEEGATTSSSAKGASGDAEAEAETPKRKRAADSEEGTSSAKGASSTAEAEPEAPKRKRAADSEEGAAASGAKGSGGDAEAEPEAPKRKRAADSEQGAAATSAKGTSGDAEAEPEAEAPKRKRPNPEKAPIVDSKEEAAAEGKEKARGGDDEGGAAAAPSRSKGGRAQDEEAAPAAKALAPKEEPAEEERSKGEAGGGEAASKKPAKKPFKPLEARATGIDPALDPSLTKPISAGSIPAPPRRAKPEPKKVKVVEIAPEAEVENDDDVDPDGKCADFLPSSSCSEVQFGKGALAECISNLIAASESSEADDDGNSVVVPDECEAEVYQFYIKRSKNINANVPLATACKEDAVRLCNNTWFFGPKQGRVVACLREVREKVSPKCKQELFKAQRAAARDYRADAMMREFCQADADRLCAGVKEGGGRVQACLRDNHLKISWECAEQLFRQELESDDDLRLSVRLYTTCLADKKRFCPDVDPGHAEAKDCLVEHREEDGFSDKCREELEKMIERRVRDFRLDSRLRKYCQKDIVALCSMLDSLGGDETDINICLQDYVNEIRDDRCKAMVKQYQQLASQDIRFDVPLADACHSDRQKFCANVPPGSARVIRCLQSQRQGLSATCRATLFDEEVRFSENLDFQYPMKKACAKEIKAFCDKVPHGNARAIRCLQQNRHKKEFGRACKREVDHFEERAASDYRLNHRLRDFCRSDIEALCKGVCPTNTASNDKSCGGTVLRCLTERQDEIKSDSCRYEVFYFLKMEVQDFNNDVILAAACRADVELYCKEGRDFKTGERSAIHDCLRRNRAKLTDNCRREQLILEASEASHIELKPTLLKSCTAERSLFCKDVKPGSGRVFKCLADHLANPDFGPVCRGEVIMKVARRQANWKLDPQLRKACRADVDAMCKSEDEARSEEGLVYKCLISNNAQASEACRKELARAVHMAFFVWIPNNVLTHPCDADIQQQCLKARPNMLHQPGAVGECIADVVHRLGAAEDGTSTARARDVPEPLAPECRVLADIAHPPDMKAAFDESLSAALIGSKLAAIEATTGIRGMVERDAKGRPEGVTLTGWTALAGIAALVVTLLGGAALAWRHYYGDPGTVVLKSRGAYSRVATSGA